MFRFGEVLGGLAWFVMRQRRQIVLRNLRIAFYGQHSVPELQEMARQTFRRTGANLLSALHVAGLSAEQIDALVTVENPEVVETALTRSPGLVLLPPHMGNWEILSRINTKFPPGHEIGAFYRPLNNPLVNTRVVKQRELDGTRLFSKRDSFHHVSSFLRNGGIVGILADQRVGKQGELVRFFGRLTRASPLPSLIARRSKSQVVAMSLITDSPGKWRVRYHPLDGPIRTATCMEALERAMKASPTDVFWLQERWKVDVRRRRPLRVWLGENPPGEIGTPHRALLWLPGAPANWQLPDEWTHPDAIYEVLLATDQPRPKWLDANAIVHVLPPGNPRKTMGKCLAAIDFDAALPIDFILAPAPPPMLQTVADRQSIPLVSLASGPASLAEWREPAEEDS